MVHLAKVSYMNAVRLTFGPFRVGVDWLAAIIVVKTADSRL